MQDWQIRVIDEKRELDSKLESLNNFIDDSSKFLSLKRAERDSLIDQMKVMTKYSGILGVRIGRFREASNATR